MSPRLKNPLRRLRAGPWKGVYDTVDPMDDRKDFLADAQNLYIPDPRAGSGAFARPGFELLNESGQLGSASSRRGQGIYSHIAADGTVYRFVACGGVLYRVDETLTIFTDVTPVGITISSAVGSRVYFASFADELIVSDGVNRPWRGTDLSATPITGTNIQYDAGNSTWSAYGRPAVFGGSLFFVLNEVGGTYRRRDLSWSETLQPGTGYEQTNFDNNWTLSQTSGAPIYAIEATEIALYYFREDSIGSIQGPVGPDLETTSTHDSVSYNIGSIYPSTITRYGNVIYFCDSIGRPYRLAPGDKPDPIWLQMRRVVDASSAGFPAITEQTASAVLEPTLNIYLAAIWSPHAAAVSPATEMYAYDAATGVYMGRWTIGAGMDVDCLGILEDNNGRHAIGALGSMEVDGEGGFMWVLRSLIGAASPLTEEDSDLMVTEDELSTLSTEGTEAVWSDNEEVPTILAKTHRLGYSEEDSMLIEQAVVVTGSSADCTLTAVTPNTSGSAVGSASSTTSQDGTYRIAWAPELSGRGCQLTISPTSSDDQWALHRVAIEILSVPAEDEEA